MRAKGFARSATVSKRVERRCRPFDTCQRLLDVPTTRARFYQNTFADGDARRGAQSSSELGKGSGDSSEAAHVAPNLNPIQRRRKG